MSAEAMQRGELQGRVALCTGASSGMGLAAARSLARRGARVMLASRGGGKLEAAVSGLRDEGLAVEGHAADVRSADDLAGLVAATEERLGGVDVLVANGGGPPVADALDLADAGWQEAFELCFLFVPRLCRLVVPGMRQRRWGRVVVVNSVSARQPIPGLVASNAFRPAVLGYLKTLAREVAHDGVTVNAVLPGYTLTERQAELAQARAERGGGTPEDVLAEWARDIPARRLARPEEVAEAITFLAGPGASYVTGQALLVDGGYAKGL